MLHASPYTAINKVETLIFKFIKDRPSFAARTKVEGSTAVPLNLNLTILLFLEFGNSFLQIGDDLLLFPDGVLLFPDYFLLFLDHFGENSDDIHGA